MGGNRIILPSGEFVGDNSEPNETKSTGLPIKRFKVTSGSSSSGISVGSSSTLVSPSGAKILERIFVNDSDETIYLERGISAFINRSTRLNARGGVMVDDLWKGPVTAICSSGSKNLTVETVLEL